MRGYYHSFVRYWVSLALNLSLTPIYHLRQQARKAPTLWKFAAIMARFHASNLLLYNPHSHDVESPQTTEGISKGRFKVV